MALTSRQTVREEVSALWDGITELQANYSYPILQLDGSSPIVDIRNGGTRPMFVSKSTNQIDHTFKVRIFVNRLAHGGTGGAEQMLDLIWLKIMQACRDNVTGTSFMELVVDDQRSEADFAETVDGIPYRIEEITVFTRSNANG